MLYIALFKCCHVLNEWRIIIIIIIIMIYHKGKLLQKGNGLGGIFSGLIKRFLPAVKVLGSKVLASPITKSIAESAKESAAKAGLQLAQDILSGENVKESLKRGIGTVGEDIFETTKKKLSGGGKKGGKRKNTKASNFKKNKKKKLYDDIFG